MSRIIINCTGQEFQGADRLTYFPVPDGAYTPDIAVYPAAGVYDPLSCVSTTVSTIPFDSAINNTKCLVLSNSIGGLGATIRVAYALWDDVTSLRGQVSVLVKLFTVTNPATSPDTYGVFCLASASDMAPGNGGQAFALVANDLGADSRLLLVQVNDGFDYTIAQLTANSYTILAQGVPANFGTRDVHTFTLEWESDPVLLKGVRLRASLDGVALWADIVHTGADAYVPTVSSGFGVYATAITHETIHYYDNVVALGGPAGPEPSADVASAPASPPSMNVPDFQEVSFPRELAFGSAGGPAWLTSLQPSPSGYDRLAQRWSLHRGRWDVGYVNRTAEESEALLAFFYCIAKGRTHGFRFRDFAPGEDRGWQEPLGVGTGTEAVYQLVKRYTSGGETYDRVITKPIADTLVVAVDGVLTPGWTLDTTTGLVTMTADVDAVLTATSFEFEVPVRFDIDQVSMSRVDVDIFSWDSIPLVEIRLAA